MTLLHKNYNFNHVARGDYVHIGDRIKNEREKNGLSVDDVAEALNKNRSTIYRYESNDIEKLPINILEPLAKVLKTTPAYLMGWIETPDIGTPSQHHEYTPHEQKVIKEYRAKPEMQPAVDKLLGIDDEDNISYLKEEKVTPFIAAESGKEYKAKPLDLETMIELDKLDKLK